MIQQLIKSQCREIPEHDFNERTESVKRKPGPKTDDGCFGNRRREHAVGKQIREILRDLEGTTVGTLDVFTDEIHAGFRFHQRFKTLVDRDT